MSPRIPAYIGANITEANKVRARAGQPAPAIVRKAPNTGHRFLRYGRAILPSLIGLAFLVMIAGLAAGWLGYMAEVRS